jgi:hypothetical protein
MRGCGKGRLGFRAALRKRSPDQKRILPRDAAPRRAVGASRDFLRCASVTSTLRALPRALPNGMDPSPHLNGVTECASMRDV